MTPFDNPFGRVADEDGTPRLCASRCSTCLFNPGAMTDGMRAVVDDARERDSFVMCHESYPHSEFKPAPDVKPAMCRGYYDAHKGTQYGLQILEQFHYYVEVPPPPPDPDQRGYRMVKTTHGVFIVERQPE